MRYLIFLAVYLTVTTYALAQELTYPNKKDKSIVRISEFYNGCGKIFDIKQDNLLPIYTKNTVLLGPEDILSAEKLMDEKFMSLVKSDARVQSLNGKSYKTMYSDFYRQYVGLINNEGERMVFIHLIKCCKANIRKCFPEWEKALGNPLDEDPCTITGSYVVNLTQKTVSLY
jgi:hypothetical protein